MLTTCVSSITRHARCVITVICAKSRFSLHIQQKGRDAASSSCLFQSPQDSPPDQASSWDWRRSDRGQPKQPPPSLTLTSSTFLYYGPQDGFGVTAPALYLGRMEACNPSRAKVAGKIVVSILDDSACRMESTYAMLSALGAVGHVNIVPWNPPGTRTFRHHSWNACEYCNSLMPWLTVPSGAADLETWTNPSLVLSIGGHHDKSYENLYLSPLWTGLLRVFALFWLWTRQYSLHLV